MAEPPKPLLVRGTLLKLPLRADGTIDEQALDAMLDEALPALYGAAPAPETSVCADDSPPRSLE